MKAAQPLILIALLVTQTAAKAVKADTIFQVENVNLAVIGIQNVQPAIQADVLLVQVIIL